MDRGYFSARSATTLWGIFLLGLLIAGCLPPAPSRLPPPPAPTVDATQLAFAAEDVEIALPMLIQTERNAAAAGNLALLGELWSEDAQIVETRGTPETGDDYTFDGRAAILDRYMVAVAQNPPTPLDAPPDVDVTVDGESATIVNGVDQWTFVERDGRWWIQSLVIAP